MSAAQAVSVDILATFTLPSGETRSIAELDALPDIDLLRLAFDEFGGRAAIGTSLQHSGLVLLDLAFRAGLALRVFTIDTLRLHAETYAQMERVERHFGITLERVQPDPAEVARMVAQHGEYLFFDSVAKRQHCCKIRKDKPNERFLSTLDCWITGVRRDQSIERAATARASVSTKYGKPILKLCPVADWSAERVEEYVRVHGLPVNPLFANGYRSIGCGICTTPVRIGENARAGRWRWEKDGVSKECGLHVESGGGI